MGQWTLINEEFIEEEIAFLNIRDLSIQRAYAIFDFLKVINTQPVFIDDHLDRFFLSAFEMRLPVPFDKEVLSTLIKKLIKKNNVSDGGLRLTLTGGNSADGFNITQPNLIINTTKFEQPGKKLFDKGIELMSYEYQRPLPHVKTIDYIMAIWLQTQILKQGADDVLYYNNGMITECPRSNFFLVTNENKLLTPEKGILKGITRMKILQLARMYYEVEERSITFEDVLTAHEAFITSTTKVLLPVSRIDKKIFNVPGVITKKLYWLFFELPEMKAHAAKQ